MAVKVKNQIFAKLIKFGFHKSVNVYLVVINGASLIVNIVGKNGLNT
jgi:hypothetical protein